MPRKRNVRPARPRWHLHQAPLLPCELLPDGLAGVLEINGTVYQIEAIMDGLLLAGYRLTKEPKRLDVYDVCLADVLSCDCPDYTFARSHRDTNGCKHCVAIRSMRADGSLP